MNSIIQFLAGISVYSLSQKAYKIGHASLKRVRRFMLLTAMSQIFGNLMGMSLIALTGIAIFNYLGVVNFAELYLPLLNFFGGIFIIASSTLLYLTRVERLESITGLKDFKMHYVQNNRPAELADMIDEIFVLYKKSQDDERLEKIEKSLQAVREALAALQKDQIVKEFHQPYNREPHVSTTHSH